ncbi:enoyl-CoA hydratase/isomerase family protein [Actinokineospora auranticolor]|uniref:Isomerase DpgB n=1 Tax=Actinokineospora auranticolor TaxID=155976 RepID=A0A2S6GMT0_9PSEU|nr:enoyl-CoA-hydratase DpgB [Actinokineospora auranticolor]PPK66535.1 isomerase DpgB [Actinokineospora auranticolor]
MSTDTTTTPHLTIDGTRPPSRDLVADLHAFADRVEDTQAAVAVLHLTGGATTEQAPLDIALVNKWERALRRLERLSATTVATVHDECGGVALEALLTTDYRIGTPDVTLRLPSGSGPSAAWPGMALYRLANQVGVARVRRAVLFDVPVTASTAVELGLLDQLAPSLDAATHLANTFTPTPASDVAVRRQLLLEATTTTFEDALGRHLAACDRVLRGGAA